MRVSLLILVLWLPGLWGCSTVNYYSQAISGHLKVMSEARSLEARLGDPNTPAPLRRKLEQALKIRRFAVAELGLPDNGSYRSYADLGRAFVLWNVFATPEFSVQPVKSCFPIAGCVDYRGWYQEADARREAQALKAKGYDIYIGGVPAYSTLGWFDDPLLNTFMIYPEPELARLMFHELAHQVVYVRGDSVFNESFAVAVEEEGMRRWHAARADEAERARYEAARERRRQFVELILAYRARLIAFYAQPLAKEERRAGKRKLLDQLLADYEVLKQAWGGYANYDRYFAQGANNALLASIATYNQRLPAFRALLAQQQGDLPAFYDAVKRLAALPKSNREAALDALARASD